MAVTAEVLEKLNQLDLQSMQSAMRDMIARKPIKKRKARSELPKKIDHYCATHDVEVYVDPDTGGKLTKIIKVEKNGECADHVR